jgi:hypothetical protein
MARMQAALEGLLTSLESYLNPNVLAAASTTRIAAGLRDGRLVLVRNAMHGAFAQRMFDCLDTCTDWELNDSYEPGPSEEGPFRYRHHNLYRDSKFPAALSMCAAVFCSPGTRSFIERLSGQPCSAKPAFGASWYQPGDHSCPHSDNLDYRSVAFVWYLTRDWRQEWGGSLYWCRGQSYVLPAFNTLALFNVTAQTAHFVTPVSPHAREKRLSINGWWRGRTTERAAAPATPDGSGLLEII